MSDSAHAITYRPTHGGYPCRVPIYTQVDWGLDENQPAWNHFP